MDSSMVKIVACRIRSAVRNSETVTQAVNGILSLESGEDRGCEMRDQLHLLHVVS